MLFFWNTNNKRTSTDKQSKTIEISSNFRLLLVHSLLPPLLLLLQLMLDMPQLLLLTTLHQLHTMKRSNPLNHLLMNMVELMSMEDTLPRLRLRMNMELSKVKIIRRVKRMIDLI